ncbi:hypothetical protein ACFOZY_07765 [Chungangia koreensis]|uniref:Secreted protein n=1 Tax=Chungangia koreensis TaxID=752657 RepID=A0ABV8X477_9LACT
MKKNIFTAMLLLVMLLVSSFPVSAATTEQIPESTDPILFDIPLPDQDFPTCTRTFESSYHDDAYVTMQAARVDDTYRSLAFSLFMTDHGKSRYGPKVRVELVSLMVNDQRVNTVYQAREDYTDYPFHGRLMNYQYQGKSGGGTLKNYDVVTMHWDVRSTTNNANDVVMIKCRV